MKGAPCPRTYRFRAGRSRFAIPRCSTTTADRATSRRSGSGRTCTSRVQRPFQIPASCSQALDRDLIRLPLEFSIRSPAALTRRSRPRPRLRDRRAGDLRRVCMFGRGRGDHRVPVGPGRRRGLRAGHRHESPHEQGLHLSGQGHGHGAGMRRRRQGHRRDHDRRRVGPATPRPATAGRRPAAGRLPAALRWRWRRHHAGWHRSAQRRGTPGGAAPGSGSSAGTTAAAPAVVAGQVSKPAIGRFRILGKPLARADGSLVLRILAPSAGRLTVAGPAAGRRSGRLAPMHRSSGHSPSGSVPPARAGHGSARRVA